MHRTDWIRGSLPGILPGWETLPGGISGTAKILHHLEIAKEEGNYYLYLKIKEEAKQWLVQASMYLDTFEPEDYTDGKKG